MLEFRLKSKAYICSEVNLKKQAEKIIYEDTASEIQADRQGLTMDLEVLREGDTLVVWKLDRLGRGLKQL